MMWRSGHAPNKGYWKNNLHHRQFFDQLGKLLGYKEMDDWYNLEKPYIYKHGGSGLLTGYYNGSPSQALQTLYPEHDWMMWRFGHAPNGFWRSNSHHRQ